MPQEALAGLISDEVVVLPAEDIKISSGLAFDIGRFLIIVCVINSQGIEGLSDMRKKSCVHVTKAICLAHPQVFEAVSRK